MAKMIPEILNPETKNNPRKQGEIKFYQCLQNKLGNDWIVFYNVNWLGKVYSSGNARDGETDFIVANPKFGVLVVEVKGGQIIEYEGLAGQWYSTNRNGVRIQIKDPYNQSRDNKYSLKNSITSWRGWEQGIGNVNLCHIVVFPDVSIIKGSLPLHAKKEITVFEDDLYNISNKLVECINFTCNGYVTDSERTRKLIFDIGNIIAPSHTIIKRKIANAISDDDKEIITLTENQYSLIRNMQYIRRLSISGCAGSGKTVLATQKALMMAQAGCDTLLCCYNQLLGDYFQSISNQHLGIVGGNFHSIIYKFMINDFAFDEGLIDQVLFDDNKLLEVFIENVPRSFDAVIIDETQDFTSIQLELLNFMTNQESSVYCFWDNNQKLLRSDFALPDNMPTYLLDTNLRNTKKIFDQVKRYYYQKDPIYCKGPDGLEIKWCKPYKSLRKVDLYEKLEKEILELIHGEQILPSDIVVLTFKSKDQSLLKDFDIKGVDTSIFNYQMSERGIRVETVRRFKGLDSSVIILTELDDYSAVHNDELWESLCYVAMSRARNYLIILPPDNCVERFNKNI